MPEVHNHAGLLAQLCIILSGCRLDFQYSDALEIDLDWGYSTVVVHKCDCGGSRTCELVYKAFGQDWYDVAGCFIRVVGTSRFPRISCPLEPWRWMEDLLCPDYRDLALGWILAKHNQNRWVQLISRSQNGSMTFVFGHNRSWICLTCDADQWQWIGPHLYNVRKCLFDVRVLLLNEACRLEPSFPVL